MAEEAERNEQLRKQGWFLGEVSNDAAASILKASGRSNTFVVYSNADTGGYTLSARFHIEGVTDDLVEHLQISSTEDRKFQVSGQSVACDDIIEAVNQYVLSSEPPLIPALGKGFETEISIPDEPPDYDNAHRVLQLDIAPLPNIASVRVETPTEAQAGSISPTSSLRRGRRYYRTYHDDAPLYMNRSHWYRYPDYHCCHPKNCFHCCCYRPTYWNGYREVNSRAWYNPIGSGPLRVIGLLLFWLLCGICFGFGKCCLFCCQCWFYICCYDDS